MKKLIALLGSVTALALTVPANAAIISIISFPPGAVFFPIANTAIFGASPTGTFDDFFTFDVPQAGTASLSLSTSSSTPGGVITFSKILFNTVSYPGALSGTGVSGIPITAFATDTIEIAGSTKTASSTGAFSGTVTFTPAPTVPEPATWATFLLGFGFLGMGLRRRSAKRLAAA